MPAFLCRFHTFTDMSAQRMTRSAVQRGRVWRPGASPRWRERGGRCLVLRGFARSCGPRSYSRLSLLLVLVLAWQPPLDACHSRGCCPWLGSVWWRRPPCPRAWPPPAPGLCFWLLLNCPPPPVVPPGPRATFSFLICNLGTLVAAIPQPGSTRRGVGAGHAAPCGRLSGPRAAHGRLQFTMPHAANDASFLQRRPPLPPPPSLPVSSCPCSQCLCSRCPWHLHGPRSPPLPGSPEPCPTPSPCSVATTC